MNFKMGDTVKCVNPRHPLILNKKYKVIKYISQYIQVEGDNTLYHSNRFVKVTVRNKPGERCI